MFIYVYVIIYAYINMHSLMCGSVRTDLFRLLVDGSCYRPGLDRKSGHVGADKPAVGPVADVVGWHHRNWL